MKIKGRRFLSAFLVVLMLFSTIGSIGILTASAETPKKQLEDYVNSTVVTTANNERNTYGSKGTTNFSKALSYANHVLTKTSVVAEDEYITAYLMLKSSVSPAHLYKKNPSELFAYRDTLTTLYETNNNFNQDGDYTYTGASWHVFSNAYQEVEIYKSVTDTAVITDLYDNLKEASDALVKNTIVTKTEYNNLLQRSELLKMQHRNDFTDERRPSNFNKNHDFICRNCEKECTARWGVAWLTFDEVYSAFANNVYDLFFSMKDTRTTEDSIVKCYDLMLWVVDYIEGFKPDAYLSATLSDFSDVRKSYHNRIVDAENFLANLTVENVMKDEVETTFANGPLVTMDLAICAFFNNVNWNNVGESKYKTSLLNILDGLDGVDLRTWLKRVDVDRILASIFDVFNSPGFNEANETGTSTLKNNSALLENTYNTSYKNQHAALLSELKNIENLFSQLRINRRDGYGALGSLYSQIEKELGTSGFSWVARHSSGSSVTDSPNMDFFIVYDKVTGAYLRASLTRVDANLDATAEEIKAFTRGSIPDLRPYVNIRFAGLNEKDYQIILPTIPRDHTTFGYFNSLNNSQSLIWDKFDELLLIYRMIFELESHVDATNRNQIVHDFWWNVTPQGINESGIYNSLYDTAGGTWAFAYRALIYTLNDFAFPVDETFKTKTELNSLVLKAYEYNNTEPPPHFANLLERMRDARIPATELLSHNFTPGEIADNIDGRLYTDTYIPLNQAISNFEAEWVRWPVSVKEAYELVLSGYKTGKANVVAAAEELAYRLVATESENIWRKSGALGTGTEVILNGRLCSISGNAERYPYLAYTDLEKIISHCLRFLKR